MNWQQPGDISLEQAQKLAKENSSKVLLGMYAEYPMSKELYQQFLEYMESNATDKEPADCSWLYGKWMKSERPATAKDELNNFSEQVKKAQEEKAKTVIKAKAVEEVIVVEVDKKQQEDYVMNHYFEKVETADEHSGGWRDFDGDDELEKHQGALDELNMKYVVRTDDMSHSILPS